MSGGSSITFTGSAASASLQVGGLGGTGFMTMTGNSIVDIGTTGAASVGATAGSSGTLAVGGGSAILANSIGIGGNSDTAAGGSGTASVTGAGSLLSAAGATGFLSAGRGGSGSLSVSDQGTVAATIVSIGRAAGGVGNLTVNGGNIVLSGQQTGGGLAGATLAIGTGGGTGTASITNGSVVSISNRRQPAARISTSAAASTILSARGTSRGQRLADQPGRGARAGDRSHRPRRQRHRPPSPPAR